MGEVVVLGWGCRGRLVGEVKGGERRGVNGFMCF